MRLISCGLVALAYLAEPSASGDPVVSDKPVAVTREGYDSPAMKPGKSKPGVIKKVKKVAKAVIGKAKKWEGKRKAKNDSEEGARSGLASSASKYPVSDVLGARPSFLQTGAEIDSSVDFEASPEGQRIRLRGLRRGKTENRSLIPGRRLIEKAIEGLRYMPRGLETLQNKTRDGLSAAKEGVRNALFGHEDEYVMDDMEMYPGEAEAEGGASGAVTMDSHPRRHVRHRRRELRLGDSFAEAKENLRRAKDVIAQKVHNLSHVHIDGEGLINNSTRNIVHMLKKLNTVAEAENKTMGEVVEGVWDHVKDTVNSTIVHFAIAQNQSADEDGSALDEDMAPHFVE